MDELDTLKKYRDLWWSQGNLHPMAEWEKAKFPYVLAENVTIDKYEEQADRFNVHGFWEWNAKLEKNDIILDEVTVYELTTQAHKACIGKISKLLTKQCSSVDDTDVEIYVLQATQTRARDLGKEPDASFRPTKPAVDSPNGVMDWYFFILDAAWPNIILEVASSESVRHAKYKARNYWLHGNRVRDVIIIKLHYDGETLVPSRMKAWHYCASGTSVQQKLKPKNKYAISRNLIFYRFTKFVIYIGQLLVRI
ncbi:hypothetical protein C2G38_2136387 [Gigaspora rosea]|uniref:Restriction endonuclease domain-containing protein n=1 Tax=Gigaspora rosea TaxID=44941 RepID=A0A397W9H9_9GLOM|nr:hypothetical protein C2G38_2136387 [Gigaspora rosea]